MPWGGGSNRKAFKKNYLFGVVALTHPTTKMTFVEGLRCGWIEARDRMTNIGELSSPSDKPLLPTKGVGPTVLLSHGGGAMPPIGFGTASWPLPSESTVKEAVLEAIKAGYRHFDTASAYHSEKPLGDAIKEAIDNGLIASRAEVFITSKLWLSDAHPELVVSALRSSLSELKIDYLDLYLIHWPLCAKPIPNTPENPLGMRDLLPIDYEGVWAAMEECQKLGLTRAIGVSNFTRKKLSKILSFAKIPPAINQVEVNPIWQQKKLIDFCKEHGVMVTAYSPVRSQNIDECQSLKEVAEAKGKTIHQVCLRWVFEQGISLVVKSFNTERMKQNLDIFDWELSVEDHEKIRQIPQKRGEASSFLLLIEGPCKAIEELWDDEI